jgi:hypothetical protein
MGHEGGFAQDEVGSEGKIATVAAGSREAIQCAA